MSNGYLLLVDAIPYGFATPGVSSVSSWVGLSNPGVTILEDTLDPPTGTLRSRLRPTEGDCDVSPLSFVLHDVARNSIDHLVTDLCTRDLDSIPTARLAASATASAVTLVVDDGSLFTTFPMDCWVNGECVQVTAKSLSVNLTVTRGMYGSRARAIEVNSAEANVPEVFTQCTGITRRRCTLLRVTDGVASIVYIGHCDHAPRLNEDGCSWTVSTTHVATRELAATIASVQGTARNVGYDDNGVIVTIETADGAGVRGSSTRLSTKARIHPDYISLLRDVAARLTASLVAAGATTPSVTVSPVGSRVTFAVSVGGIGAYALRVRVGDNEATASSVDTGTVRRAKVELWGGDNGAITRFAWQPYTTPPRDDTQRLTVLEVSPSLSTSNASWAPITSSGAVRVNVSPVLAAPWDDDYQLILDPRTQIANYWKTANTTNVDPSHTTFRAVAYLRAKDAAVAVPPPAPTAGSLVYSGVLVFQREYLVESSHWLYALQWVLAEDGVSNENDPRNWDWTDIAKHAAATGGGVVAEVNWRIAADRSVGEFVVDECALRGACVSVKGGKLCVVAVRQPTASETVVASFTDDDLASTPGDEDTAPRAQLEQWEDGVVTAVQITSPMRDIRTVDAVARARYGDGRTIELRAEGLRNARAAIDDPVQWSRSIAQRPLRLWSQPVYLLRLPLAGDWRGTLELGDVIEVTVSTLPSGQGTRGLVDRRAQVIGLEENFETGEVTVEALIFATAYTYAPCARVDSISGDTVTLVDAYAGTPGDYAGSALPSYTGLANDGGTSMFNVGDFIELVERDTNTPFAPELREVIAVTPGSKTLKLDASPSATWATLPWVDVRTAAYADSVAAQRLKWMFASSTSAPQEIASGVKARKWAV